MGATTWATVRRITCIVVASLMLVAGDVTIHPNATYAELGDSVYMECHVANRVGSVNWRAATGTGSTCNSNCDQYACYNVIIDCKNQDDPDIVYMLIPNINSSSYFGEWKCLSFDKDTATQHLQQYLPAKVDLSWTPDMLDGEDTDFTCLTVDGNPGPKHYWYRDTDLIDPQPIQSNGSGWEISQYSTRLKRGDSGYISCIAKQLSYKDEQSDEAAIDVKYPAEWDGGEPFYTSLVGDNNTVMHCNVTANPAPQFSWKFNSSNLRPGITVNGAMLCFDRVLEDDFGIYTCNATNIMQTSLFYISLNASGRPETPQSLTELDNITSTSITVTWVVGHNMGSSQLFKVEYRKQHEEEYTVEYSGIPAKIYGELHTETVDHLDNNTVYTIAVIAYNGYDGGDNYSDSSTISAETISRPEVMIREILVSNGRAFVAWEHISGKITRLQLGFRGIHEEDYVILKDHIDRDDYVIYASHEHLRSDESFYFQLLFYEKKLHYTTTPGGHVVVYQASIEESGLSDGAIAGIVITVVVFLVLISLLIFFVLRDRGLIHNTKSSEESTDEADTDVLNVYDDADVIGKDTVRGATNAIEKDGDVSQDDVMRYESLTPVSDRNDIVAKTDHNEDLVISIQQDRSLTQHGNNDITTATRFERGHVHEDLLAGGINTADKFQTIDNLNRDAYANTPTFQNMALQ